MMWQKPALKGDCKSFYKYEIADAAFKLYASIITACIFLPVLIECLKISKTISALKKSGFK